ncbi:2-deoxy-D-gluconate 3-dehydrogenase [Spirochaetia bacterium]|nr:2-deoxy-D-gluconate 3-dehydrogenase [Spirochaetia bacterium]
MKLKDKVVILTDGSSPLGAVIAERLKQEGAIIASSGAAHAVSKKDVDGAVLSILDKYGKIDVVVHNNNEVIRANLEDCSDELYDRALNINLKSAFLMVQAAGVSMKAAKSGNFVFVSSIHDEKPTGAAFGYSIAKGALKMLVREMVLDMGPLNVRTNIVEAGPLEGDDEKFYSDISPLYEHTRERIVNGQYGTMEDIANAVLFFAGNDCPAANGSELKLDGGFLLSYLLRSKKGANIKPFDPALLLELPEARS